GTCRSRRCDSSAPPSLSTPCRPGPRFANTSRRPRPAPACAIVRRARRRRSRRRAVAGPRGPSARRSAPPVTETTPHESGVDGRAIAKRAAFFVVVAVAAVVGISALPGVDEVRDHLAGADPRWLVAVAACAIGSMLGFVRALWAVFDRVVPWRRALVLGLAEQGANVLIPAGGAGGPALGAYVMQRIGVPGELAAQRHAALFLATSAVSFFAMALFGTLTSVGLLPSDASLWWRLIPAEAATAIIALAIVYARLPSPVERAGGRISASAWRVRRFLHDADRRA